MSTIEVIIGLVIAVCVWMACRQAEGKPYKLIHFPSAEEKEQAIQRQMEIDQLTRLPRDFGEQIHTQYLTEFSSMPYDSDFVKPEYVEYFRREEAAYQHLPVSIKKRLFNNGQTAFINNHMSGWMNYCSAFAAERMIRDKTGYPQILRADRIYWDYTKALHPKQSAIDKVWHHYWHHTHYPALIKKFNETGEFIPGWKWQPLDRIPDYHKDA